MEIGNLLDEVLNAMGGAEPSGYSDAAGSDWLVKKQVEFPQTKGDRHSDERGLARAGQIYVGPLDNVKQGYYTQELRFLLVATHTLTLPPLPGSSRPETVGGRRMRAYTRNAQDAIVRDMESPDACRSANGVVPHEKYIGTQVMDSRTGRMHTIGNDASGRPVTMMVEVNGVTMPDICRNCPLQDWAGGKPPCEPAWSFVIYVLPEDPNEKGFLARIKGENSGVQNALRGAKKGSGAARYDGEELVGIRHYFAPQRNKKQFVVPSTTVRPAQYGSVIGVCADDKLNGFVSSGPDNVAELVERHPFTVMNVTTYPYAPEGRPEVTGMFNTVHPVTMTVTRNAYTLPSTSPNAAKRPNPTFVPDFHLNDKDVVSEVQYVHFLEMVADYYGAETNRQMMRLGGDVVNKLAEAYAPLLPSSTPPAVDDGEPVNGIVF